MAEMPDDITDMITIGLKAIKAEVEELEEHFLNKSYPSAAVIAQDLAEGLGSLCGLFVAADPIGMFTVGEVRIKAKENVQTEVDEYDEKYPEYKGMEG